MKALDRFLKHVTDDAPKKDSDVPHRISVIEDGPLFKKTETSWKKYPTLAKGASLSDKRARDLDKEVKASLLTSVSIPGAKRAMLYHSSPDAVVQQLPSGGILIIEHE